MRHSQKAFRYAENGVVRVEITLGCMTVDCEALQMSSRLLGQWGSLQEERVDGTQRRTKPTK